MSLLVKQLTRDDHGAFAQLWQAALHRRRELVGLERFTPSGHALQRPGSFGVGIFEGTQLLSAAVALQARADDGRSMRNVPGLVHISSVATHPDRWREGLARRAVEAILGQSLWRGFARAQLWTYQASRPTQRLYEGSGFRLTGRLRANEAGDHVVQYIRELDAPEPIARPAARVICLDDADRVLLMHWRDTTNGHQIWEPPGGGIESGETPLEAAVREWAEETGLPIPEILAGPVNVGRDMFWNGGRLVGDEQFFLARLANPPALLPAALTAGEQESLLGHAWVSIDGLDDLEDSVEPDLVPVIARLTEASTHTS